jgi:pre-mRNA-processing factor 17
MIAVYPAAATARRVNANLPTHIMHAPVAGPANPNDSTTMPAGMRNHWGGQAEDAHVNSFTFDDQYHRFVKSGVAADPASGTDVQREMPVQDQAFHIPKKKRKAQQVRSHDGQRGTLDRPFVLRSRQPWAEKDMREEVELTEEQKEKAASLEEKKAEKAALAGKGDYSIFHGSEAEDYQGRSWMDPPAGIRQDAGEACFLPKRLVHCWKGHTKGVNCIHFFPKHGHLLLSAGLDGKAKVWQTVNKRDCMRTYIGHSKGIRDCWFSEGGRKFVTAAYDKAIKLWDTETGSVVQTLGDGQTMAFTVRTHPEQPDVLLAGMQNKKILQYDVRSGDSVQEYNYHLGPVNTLAFIDENRKFISTSDDKSIRVWEFGVPVPAKYFADPTMHAISSASVTPNGKWWIGQSADNHIVTYSADEKVRPNKKKTFSGHSSAGYACQVGVSHDNHYLYSGDGEGKLFIWDWKTKKVLRSLKAHEGVCIGCEWHPQETSKIATCGWDGLIKYWD